MMAQDKEDNDSDDKPIELPIVKPNRRRQDEVASTTKTSHRDPRFDPRCSGSNDARHFVRNYAFLDEVRKDELKALEKALKKESDVEKKNKIKSTISRIRNKMQHHSTTSQTQPSSSHRKSKKELLADKFHELKQNGKLDKYLQRKRKKLIKRDSKFV